MPIRNDGPGGARGAAGAHAAQQALTREAGAKLDQLQALADAGDVDGLVDLAKGLSPELKTEMEYVQDERNDVHLYPHLDKSLRTKDVRKFIKAWEVGLPEARRGQVMSDYGVTKGESLLLGGIQHIGTKFTFGLTAGDDVITGRRRDGDNRAPKVMTPEFIREQVLPNLKPGDMIINGCKTKDSYSLGHLACYIGDGKIIHSMATESTGETLPYRGTISFLTDILDGDNKRGVIMEGLDEFMGRFARESLAVVRMPGLTDDQVQEGVEGVKKLLGKGYDYSFAPGNDELYCTEVGLEFWRSAVGQRNMPRADAQPEHQALGPIDLLAREGISHPEDVLASEDVELVLYTDTAEQGVEKYRGDRFAAERAALPPVEIPASGD